MINTHQQALQVLSYDSQCLDTAIEFLERSARTDARVLTDVAAAYYVRAQKEDDASDLLPAMKFARQAVDHTPRSSVARFNLALIQEALGLHPAAIESWDFVRAAENSEWATEATERRNALAKKIAGEAATLWPRYKRQLEAIDPRDGAAVARLVDRFPYAAQKMVEEELLPRWDLARARAIGEALHKRHGDRYVLDMVVAAEKTPALRNAHQQFAEARLAQRALRYVNALTQYERAADDLQAGGSPLHYGARIGMAAALFQYKREAEGLVILEAMERPVRQRQYLQLIGHLHITRGLLLLDSHIAAYDEYKTAIEQFISIRDFEGVADAYRGLGAARRYAEDYKQAWSEMFRARHYAGSSVEPQSRHHIFGESAAVAQAFKSSELALAYQQHAMTILRSALATTPPEQVAHIRGLQQNVCIVLRKLASMEFHLGRPDVARRHIDEALRLALSESEGDAIARNALLAGTYEVAGQIAVDPASAIDAYTRALAFGGENGYRTVRANVYAKRAEQHRRLNNLAAAEADLKSALAELADEQKDMLASRDIGEGEDVWGTYFGRFEEASQQLIALYMKTGRPQKAFEQAESARAIEPLDLLLRQREIVPEGFAKLLRENVELRRIQERIPDDTYLLQYSVHTDETFVWIISRNQFRHEVLPVGSKQIREWSEELYVNARRGSEGAYYRVASDVYQAVVATPLSMVPVNPRRRLVFIPDGPLHAVPMAALRVGGQYLVERELIASNGSARLFLWSHERNAALSASGVPSALLVGNPTNATDLPRAATEVQTIARLYNRSRVLVGDQATESEFLRLARQSAVVHVAAHAYADAKAPHRSYIALTPANGDGGELRADELVTRLQINKTRLFVLSACNSAGSASGFLVGPEGVAPLVRPLITAGVPAVVGSVWFVGDAAAEALLVRFHEHLRDGRDAAEALQAAQLDLLRGNQSTRWVFNWGAFQVIGHAGSPFPPPPKSIKEK